MKKVEFLKHRLIAHRGKADKNVVENTLPAFLKCIRKKYIIELDIHILNDNTIVVYHDFNLNRLCRVNRIIETLNYEQLSKYKIKNKYTIPTLKTVMHIVDGKVPLLIDIKDLNNNRNFEIELLKILNKYEGSVALQSVNPSVLTKLKKSNYVIGQIINREKNIKLINFMFKGILNNINFISCNIKTLNQKNSKRIKKRFFLIGWTVNTSKDLKKYSLLCDNLICEKIL